MKILFLVSTFVVPRGNINHLLAMKEIISDVYRRIKSKLISIDTM
jgi:hypothetical protein